MDLLKLKYFHTVALLGNMTRAAETLHISQPSLNSMIRRLEEEVGVPLFDRVGRGIVLNAYGSLLLEHTTKMMHEIDKINTELEAMKNGKERTITICGNVESMGVGLICQFFEKTSNYSMKQRYCTIKSAERLLLNNEYQFAITMPALSNDFIKTITICSGEALACYMSVDNPLSQMPMLSLSQLKDEDFVTRYRGESFSALHKEFMENNYGFSPRIIYEGNALTLQYLIRNNKGIYIASHYDDAMIADPKIVKVPLKDEHHLFNIGLSWGKEAQKNPQCQYFIQFAKKYYNNMLAN